MNTRIQTGKAGEQAAKTYLIAHGYRIVQENWRCRSGELDLIAEVGECLVFIEVRTQTGYGYAYGTPQESVNLRKQQQVRKLAQIYMTMHGIRDREVRFDMVSVILSKSAAPAVEHVPNAF